MLKYLKSEILLAEVPNEICIAYAVTGCSLKCPNCHSKHTWDGTKGHPLTFEVIEKDIMKNKYITAILFYGGEWEEKYLLYLLRLIKANYPKLKRVLYTGCTLFQIKQWQEELLWELDYIKTGRYVERYGPLTTSKTNQKYHKVTKELFLNDITSIFWLKEK